MTGFIIRIRRHLADPHSQHRKIAFGIVWVSAFVLVGKLAGASKEITIAWRYGLSETVDAYVLVLNLVNWPVSVWFGILTVVLVPLAARLRHDAPQELSRFRAELLGLTMIIGSAIGLLAWLTLPTILRSGWLGLSDDVLARALAMSGGLSLLAPLGVVTGLFSAWLLAAGHHRNTLFEGIPALTLIAALLFPFDWLREPLLWGTVVGYALQMVALAVPLHRRRELRPPAFRQHSPAWQGFWGAIRLMAIGQVLMTCTNLIDQFFAASLGPGALSTLNYANRILALPLGMVALAIGRATLPVFSEIATEGGTTPSTVALRWAGWMFTVGIGGLLIGWMAASWVVELLFQRGAFTAEDGARVAEALKFALVQTPFYASALTLVQFMAGQKRYGVLLLSGAIGLTVKAITAPALVATMQLNGLILSSTAVYCANALFFYLYLRRLPR